VRGPGSDRQDSASPPPPHTHTRTQTILSVSPSRAVRGVLSAPRSSNISQILPSKQPKGRWAQSHKAGRKARRKTLNPNPMGNRTPPAPPPTRAGCRRASRRRRPRGATLPVPAASTSSGSGGRGPRAPPRGQPPPPGHVVTDGGTDRLANGPDGPLNRQRQTT
jgi:hypothetical protein